MFPQHAGVQPILMMEISAALCMPLSGAKDRRINPWLQDICWSVHGVTAAKRYEVN